MRRDGIHQDGYTPDAPDDETRDLIREAGRMARGTSAMIGGAAHVLALVDEVGGALRDVLDAYDRLQVFAVSIGRGAHEHAAVSQHARAVLDRLETADEAEDAWIAIIGLFCPRCAKRYHAANGGACPACGSVPTATGRS